MILVLLGQSECLSNTAMQAGLHGRHLEISPSLPQKQDTAIQLIYSITALT